MVEGKPRHHLFLAASQLHKMVILKHRYRNCPGNSRKVLLLFGMPLSLLSPGTR